MAGVVEVDHMTDYGQSYPRSSRFMPETRTGYVRLRPVVMDHDRSHTTSRDRLFPAMTGPMSVGVHDRSMTSKTAAHD